MGSISRTVGIAALSLSAIFASSCATMNAHMSIEGKTKNADLFENRDAVMSRVIALKSEVEKGTVIGKEATFTVLGIDINRFRLLDNEEIMKVRYGGAQPHPQNAEDMDSIDRKLRSMEVYRLQAKNISDKVGLMTGLGIETLTEGFDHDISLVFENGTLVNVITPGEPIIHETDEKYILKLPEQIIKNPPRIPIP